MAIDVPNMRLKLEEVKMRAQTSEQRVALLERQLAQAQQATQYLAAQAKIQYPEISHEAYKK